MKSSHTSRPQITQESTASTIRTLDDFERASHAKQEDWLRAQLKGAQRRARCADPKARAWIGRIEARRSLETEPQK